MSKRPDNTRVKTGISNLDAILMGGLPKGSVSVLSGPPGSGKTILSQQICFHNASPKERVIFFGTLSEPTANTLRHVQQFSFCDAKKIGSSVHFVDLSVTLQATGLESVAVLMMKHIKAVKPAFVVIDSFKVFDDLVTSKAELRQFIYDIVVHLMAWEITTLLLGEYASADHQTNALFAIVDGLMLLSQQDSMGERQRFFQIVKLRGTDHSRAEHPFMISPDGVELFAARSSIRLEHVPGSQARCKTYITKLDEILGPGIPLGSSLLISGVAGTGKTVLSLEFIYRGALAGEKGILFSFEETEERLRAAAKGLGWDLDREIRRGMVEIVFIPEPDISVEAHLVMIQQRVEKLQAKRVVIDSVSVFLHKVESPQISREKVFHLCSIVQNNGAVGFFPTDIPYGSVQVSRYGVEETVVDGVIILTSTEEGHERERYIEVYKLRNTAHLKGRHNMQIGPGGVAISPRYREELTPDAVPPALEIADRLKSGIPGLDAFLGGGFLRRSVTLISGSAGIGKTVFGLQFLLEGAKRNERGLYVTLEEGPKQLLASADALNLPLREMVAKRRIQILYVSRENVRAGQFLTVLADQLVAMKAGRIVLDAATQMLTEHMELDEFRHVLYKLGVRFKTLGITSVLTMEAQTLISGDRVTEMGISPIADNLLMLRYERSEDRLSPTLTIVKTRGSEHDRRRHHLVVTSGGMRIGDPSSERAVRGEPKTPPGKPHKPRGSFKRRK